MIAKSNSQQLDREFLHSGGWRERSCAGPWRWYRKDWKPITYYTLHDAVALERARLKDAIRGRKHK